MQTPASLQKVSLEKQLITSRYFVSNFQFAVLYWPPHCSKARSSDIFFAQQKPCVLTSQRRNPSFSPFYSTNEGSASQWEQLPALLGLVVCLHPVAIFLTAVPTGHPKYGTKHSHQSWLELNITSIVKLLIETQEKLTLRLGTLKDLLLQLSLLLELCQATSASGEETAASINPETYLYECFLLPLPTSWLLRVL